MELTTLQRPSLLAAASAPVAHEVLVGHLAVWAGPAAFAAVRLRAAGGYGTDGSTEGTTTGKRIPMNAQLVGDVRGVPPRGRPV